MNDVLTVEGPAFAESISEGDIRWLKRLQFPGLKIKISEVGDQVNEDELIAEIETDKTSVEVNAPQSGTLVEFLVEEGSKVVAKQKLYKLQPGAAAAPAPV